MKSLQKPACNIFPLLYSLNHFKTNDNLFVTDDCHKIHADVMKHIVQLE